MDRILYPAGAVIAWFAFFYKTMALRRDRDSPALRAMSASFLVLALAFTFGTPWIYTWLDATLGVPNLARICTHVSAMAWGFAAARWLLCWTYPTREEIRPRVMWRLGVFSLAVAAMAVLFWLAPVDEDTLEFSTRYGNAPYVPEYMLVYVAYFGMSMADITRLAWKYSSLVARPFTRIGLRLTSVGAMFGVAYCLEKAAYMLCRILGVAMVSPAAQENISPVLASSGGVMLLIGITIPAWGPRFAVLPATVRRYLAFRRLGPLWQTLYLAVPEIALEAPQRRSRFDLGLRDLDYRLLRRVVEIRDARLALRPYLDAQVAEAAEASARGAGLDAQQRRATVEAAVIAAALRRKRDGEPAQEPYPVDGAGGDDLMTEATWLAKVAKAYTGSPVVAAAAQEPRPVG